VGALCFRDARFRHVIDKKQEMAEKQQVRPSVRALFLFPGGGYELEHHDGILEKSMRTERKNDLEFHISVGQDKWEDPITIWWKFLCVRFGFRTGTTRAIRVLQVDNVGQYCNIHQDYVELFASYKPDNTVPNLSPQEKEFMQKQALHKSEAEAIVQIVLRKYKLGQREFHAIYTGSACDARYVMSYIIRADCEGVLLDTDLEEDGDNYVIIVKWAPLKKEIDS